MNECTDDDYSKRKKKKEYKLQIQFSNSILVSKII